jgi:hypothetical protein
VIKRCRCPSTQTNAASPACPYLPQYACRTSQGLDVHHLQIRYSHPVPQPFVTCSGTHRHALIAATYEGLSGEPLIIICCWRGTGGVPLYRAMMNRIKSLEANANSMELIGECTVC